MNALERFAARRPNPYLALFAGVVILYGAVFLFAASHAHANGVSLLQFMVATGDSAGYLQIGETLLSVHRFSTSAHDVAEVFRTPGYPGLVALSLAIFGGLVPLVFLQILLGAGSALLTFLIGEHFFSRRVALAGALLFAVEPTVLSTSLIILSDTSFVFLFLLSAWAVLCLELNTARASGAGIVLGLATLVRPLGMFIVPLLILWLFLRSENLKIWMLHAVYFCVGVALCIVPWMVRNDIVGGRFALSSINTYNPLMLNIVQFEAVRTGMSEASVREAVIKEMGATYGRDLDTFKYSVEARRVIRAHLFAHPFEYLAFHAVKMLPFFFGAGTAFALEVLRFGTIHADANMSTLLFHGKIAAAISALLNSPVASAETLLWLLAFVCAGYALLNAARDREKRPILIYLAIVVLFFAVTASPVTMPRYRIPAEPFYFLLVCEGAVLVFSAVRRFSRQMLKPQIPTSR